MEMMESTNYDEKLKSLIGKSVLNCVDHSFYNEYHELLIPVQEYVEKILPGITLEQMDDDKYIHDDENSIIEITLSEYKTDDSYRIIGIKKYRKEKVIDLCISK